MRVDIFAPANFRWMHPVQRVALILIFSALAATAQVSVTISPSSITLVTLATQAFTATVREARTLQ